MPDEQNQQQERAEEAAEDAGELMSVADAARVLGISRSKINLMIRLGELQVVDVNPLDKRQRLVRRADVETLLRRAPKDAAA